MYIFYFFRRDPQTQLFQTRFKCILFSTEHENRLLMYFFRCFCFKFNRRERESEKQLFNVCVLFIEVACYCIRIAAHN